MLKIHTLLQEQGKSYQWLSDETGISKSFMDRKLARENIYKPDHLLVIIAEALKVSIEDLTATGSTQEAPLQIVIHGELSNHNSKRTFDSALYAIEDYMAMKQVD